MTSRFIFNGYAVALGGRIDGPPPRLLENQAATVLQVSGGYGYAEAGPFRLDNIVSFEKAHSSVSGNVALSNGAFSTVVQSTIEGLNIQDMVTADLVASRLVSVHLVEGRQRYNSIIPLGSHFVNLRIAGVPVQPRSHVSMFTELDTYDKVERAFAGDKEFQNIAREDFLWGLSRNATMTAAASEFLQERFGWCGKAIAKGEHKPPRLWDGSIPTSLFGVVDGLPAGVSGQGHVIVVPEFGKVFLGELLITPESRRLTMLRVELGSPESGEVSTGGTGGNGTPPNP